MRHVITRLKRKVSNVLYKRIKQRKLSINSWVSHIEIGNLLVSLSTTGLMALGVIPLSFPLLVSLALFLLVVGIVGRYLDSIEDDAERLLVYEKHLTEGVARVVPDSPGDESIQQQDPRSEER